MQDSHINPVVLLRCDRSAAVNVGQIYVTRSTNVGLQMQLRCSNSDTERLPNIFINLDILKCEVKQILFVKLMTFYTGFPYTVY